MPAGILCSAFFCANQNRNRVLSNTLFFSSKINFHGIVLYHIISITYHFFQKHEIKSILYQGVLAVLTSIETRVVFYYSKQHQNQIVYHITLYPIKKLFQTMLWYGKNNTIAFGFVCNRFHFLSFHSFSISAFSSA